MKIPRWRCTNGLPTISWGINVDRIVETLTSAISQSLSWFLFLISFSNRFMAKNLPGGECGVKCFPFGCVFTCDSGYPRVAFPVGRELVGVWGKCREKNHAKEGSASKMFEIGK
jgi:hypothetical protein